MWASPIKRFFLRGVTITNASMLWLQARLATTIPALFDDAALALGLSKGDVVLVIVPHPDDETLGMGGTLAALTDAGVHVHLLLLTDGSLSAAGLLRPLPPNQRASIRGAEFQSAIRCISPKISHSGPVCVEQSEIKSASKTEAIQVARRLVKDLRPQMIFAPPPFDYHPHHVFAATLAATLVKARVRDDTSTNDISLLHYEVQSPFTHLDQWIGIVANSGQEARYLKAANAYKTQAQTVKNSARLKMYRRVQTKAHAHVDVFLKGDLATDCPMQHQGLSSNPTHDLRLLRGDFTR
jgi:LmbE family N-acetylglucosaminyl deacetylase